MNFKWANTNLGPLLFGRGGPWEKTPFFKVGHEPTSMDRRRWMVFVTFIDVKCIFLFSSPKEVEWFHLTSPLHRGFSGLQLWHPESTSCRVQVCPGACTQAESPQRRRGTAESHWVTWKPGGRKTSSFNGELVGLGSKKELCDLKSLVVWRSLKSPFEKQNLSTPLFKGESNDSYMARRNSYMANFPQRSVPTASLPYIVMLMATRGTKFRPHDAFLLPNTWKNSRLVIPWTNPCVMILSTPSMYGIFTYTYRHLDTLVDLDGTCREICQSHGWYGLGNVNFSSSQKRNGDDSR